MEVMGVVNRKADIWSESKGSLMHEAHQHGIKSFRHFGESGSVDVQDMEQKLVSIREKIDQFPMKDVFNMDEMRGFIGYKLIIHWQQNNLKEENKIKKG
ncbi:unnamed protein product [Vicia faba]|uniref:Uncharacterized protein n=1 Tax=Vicia faba TaxID=3906 RepID=A0AAV0YSP4_VICFA|nr:unnamed protein product [Vicia faba]